MYAVTVTFTLHPGQMGAFLPLMAENARTSRALEPGCLQFDICHGGAPDRVFLYEVYTDRESFEAHLASDHFRAFDAAVSDMVAGKDVALYEEVTR